MKMGNIASLCRYEAGTGAALQSPQMRRTGFLCDASMPIRDVGDAQGMSAKAITFVQEGRRVIVKGAGGVG